ncbi:MAG: hypothetical protein WKF57_01665 [Nakamurella sp.]
MPPAVILGVVVVGFTVVDWEAFGVEVVDGGGLVEDGAVALGGVVIGGADDDLLVGVVGGEVFVDAPVEAEG